MKQLLNKEYEKPIFNTKELFKKKKKYKQIVLTPHTSKKKYFTNSSKSSNKLTFPTSYFNKNNIKLFDEKNNSRNFNKSESFRISLKLIGIGGSLKFKNYYNKNNNINNLS
jgi:hypothetical protein